MASLKNATSLNTNGKLGVLNIDTTKSSGPACSCNKAGLVHSFKIAASGPMAYSNNPGSSNGPTIIKSADFRPGGTTQVQSNHDIVWKHSQSDIDTTAVPKTTHCINPAECDRMKFLTANSDFNQLTLENTLSDALASVNIAKTFEEVEELVEMHECSQLQRRLTSIVEDKKRRLETRAQRRKAELLERKAEFTRSVIYKIGVEREEMTQMQNRLLTLLNQDSTNKTKSMAEMSKFEPVAESTRISHENNVKHVTVEYSSPQSQCQCKRNTN